MRDLRALIIFSALAPAVGASAAEPARPEPAKAEAAKPDTGKVVGPPEVAWKEMTSAQKSRYMKDVVVPKMKGPFQEFDAKEFKKFNCASCHGEQGKARKFKMPNPELPALPNSPEAFQAMMKKKADWPKWTKFMAEVVTPQMATLLGTHHFDPKKPDAGGFSCNGCHVLKKMD